MKARLVPLYFDTADDPDFVTQVQALRNLLADDAEILAQNGFLGFVDSAEIARRDDA